MNSESPNLESGRAAAAGAAGTSYVKVDIKRALAKNAGAIDEVRTAIKRVQEARKRVEVAIERVEVALEGGEHYLHMDVPDLEVELKRLMEEGRLLMKKKLKLMDKELKLMDKELKLMDRQHPSHGHTDFTSFKMWQEIHEVLVGTGEDTPTVAVSKLRSTSSIWGNVQEEANSPNMESGTAAAADTAGTSSVYPERALVQNAEAIDEVRKAIKRVEVALEGGEPYLRMDVSELNDELKRLMEEELKLMEEELKLMDRQQRHIDESTFKMVQEIHETLVGTSLGEEVPTVAGSQPSLTICGNVQEKTNSPNMESGTAAAADTAGTSSTDPERALAKNAQVIDEVRKARKKVEVALEGGEPYLHMGVPELKAERIRLMEKWMLLMDEKLKLMEEELKLMDMQQQRHSAGSTFNKMVQEIYERVMAQGTEETRQTPTVAVSKANSKIWSNVQERAKLTAAPFPRKLQVAASRSGAIPPFEWTNGSEPSHAPHYKVYLEERIGNLVDPGASDAGLFRLLVGDTCILDADDLAEVVGYKLHGTPDAVMVYRSAAKVWPLTGLRVVFELKKVVENKNHWQAMLYLLLANWHVNRLKPIVILTDLANSYTFYWLDGRTVFYYKPDDAASAWGLFDALLAGEHELPCVPLEGVVPKEGAETVALPITKRQRLFLDTAEADDDVANLADLEGFLSPEELRAAKMGQLLQQFFALPFVKAHGLG